MKLITMTYEGKFPLQWLADDESVANCGDGTDAAIVEWPGGELRIPFGASFIRHPDGRLILWEQAK